MKTNRGGHGLDEVGGRAQPQEGRGVIAKFRQAHGFAGCQPVVCRKYQLEACRCHRDLLECA